MGLGSLFPIAIASGIGQGIGGAGQAIAQARETQRKREEGQIDLGALAAQGITFPGVPTVGKLPTPMVDVLIKAGATKAAQDREETANRTLAGSLETTFPGAVVSPGHLSAAADLNTLATTPTPLDGPDAAGISERRAQPLPAASRPTPIQVAIDTLRAGSAGKEGRGEAFKGAMEFTKQQREEQFLNDWLARQGGGANPLGIGSSVKAGPLTLNQPAQQPNQVTKQIGNREVHYSLHPTTGAIIAQTDLGEASSARGVYNRQDAENQVNLEHTTPGNPNYGKLPKGTLAWQQRYNDLARQVQIGPGGAVFGPGTGLQPAPTQTTPTQAALPTGQPLASRPALPNPGEREDIAAMDAARTQLQNVVNALKEGKLTGVMGGVLKNPGGALARAGETYLGYGLTDEQRKLIGTAEIQLQAAKHALIGATRTRPELADIAGAIPDIRGLLTGDTAEQAISKLEATIADMDARRGAREHVMGSTGVAVPPRPAGNASTPRPNTGWKIEREK